MKVIGALPLAQHNTEIQRNQKAWARKPMLRKVYHDFYGRIASRIDPTIPGPVVELGSGMGRIKDVIPQCMTTDLFPNPWLDRQENCYQLSFADGSVSHLILFDVWHHLRYPGTALREFRRALAPGGRLILFEPAASWVGRFVYHFFHHEPVAVRDPITWEAPEGFSAADADYYAAQGSATRLFWWGEGRARLNGWHLREVRPLASFDYFASGGFSGPQLGGRFLHGLVRSLDFLTAPFPRIFAARLLIVLEKENL
ncbi:class I SAM-dependent methyltransferase [Opitutus sp. GAS368]|jgi:SAM-dependent methyltransferase|uniref:class I SAM-dependent methyltransferase n=1 Tax=Opitutus sp. GAS368 TaxID=1882749 RepID=UPI0008793A8C|nr:class I SAM-dependent methyltransferase [Opitutus sp. GAS368]SDS26261.1 Methyltransferase domain-containing protein [Opitutus sp. GAS368]